MKVLIATVFLSGLLAGTAESTWCAEKGVPSARLERLSARTLADVQLVLDKNKGAFYALYTRATREMPGLRGRIVLSFSIAPSGAVMKCTVNSSTLNHPELERKIVERFSAIKFGVKGTGVYVNPGYPMTFP